MFFVFENFHLILSKGFIPFYYFSFIVLAKEVEGLLILLTFGRSVYKMSFLSLKILLKSFSYCILLYLIFLNNKFYVYFGYNIKLFALLSEFYLKKNFLKELVDEHRLFLKLLTIFLFRDVKDLSD